MKFSKAEKDFVENMRVGRVATVGPDGVPHTVPVCPLFDDNKIYFATERKAKKLRNIKSNSTVAVVFDEYTEAWDNLLGVMVSGTARVVNAKEFPTLRKKIYAKYTQYESHAAIGVRDSVIVEVTPEKKFSWGFE